MSGETMRRFLFDVRPAHRETMDSYTRRVSDANYCGPWLRAHLLRSNPEAKSVAAKESAWSEILSAKTGRTPLRGANEHGWLRHEDGDACEFCADMLTNRWMCSLCSHDDRVEQYPHFDTLVCTRHSRWVGIETGVEGQHSVGTAHIAAAREFRQLRWNHRIDVRLYAVVSRGIRAEPSLVAETESEAFPLAMDVIHVVTSPTVSRALLDPKTAYSESFAKLTQIIESLAGRTSEVLTRAIWLHMRSAAASYRTSLILGETYVALWPHDFPFTAPVPVGPAQNRADWDSFSNFLAASEDTTTTANQYGLDGFANRTALDAANTPFSHRPTLAICPEGHQYEANAPVPSYIQLERHPVRKLRSCTVCSNKTVQRGQNDLETRNPKAASEFDVEANGGIRASDVAVGSHRKFWWRCSKGHPFEATPSNRCNGPLSCPVCGNRQMLAGYNDVGTTHPHLLASWHPSSLIKFPPSRHHAGSDALVDWICENEHTYQLSIARRVAGVGCNVCRHRPATLQQSLDLTHPHLAAEWSFERNHGLTPADVTGGSAQMAGWVCPVGHSYWKRIEHRTRGYGCNVCSKRMLVPNVNDLATTQPLLSQEFHPYLNNVEASATFASNHLFHWLCQHGHTTQQTVQHRLESRGCVTCSPPDRILAL